MKKHIFSLALIALLLVVGTSTKNALAYFTTFARSNGTVAVELSDETIIHEEIDGHKKIIAINNNGNSPEYVRLAMFAPEDLKQFVTINDANWTYDGNRYYTYKNALDTGDSVTVEVIIDADTEAGKAAFEKAKERGTISIIVVYETTTSLNGDEANWTATIKDLSTEVSSQTTNTSTTSENETNGEGQIDEQH